MKWYKDLYVGERAKKHKHRIISRIAHRKMQVGIYVITLPVNGEDILDIYPSYILNQKYYQRADMKIVGIADGYEEALDIMQRIVMDCFYITNQFKVREMTQKEGFR